MIGTLLALMALSVSAPDSQGVKAAHTTVPPVCTEQKQFDFQVDRPAVFVGDSGTSPHPSAAVRTPANLVQFVVDTSGRVQRETFLAIRVTDSTLVRDAEAALDRWRYVPAVEGTCKVPQLVQTPVER